MQTTCKIKQESLEFYCIESISTPKQVQKWSSNLQPLNNYYRHECCSLTPTLTAKSRSGSNTNAVGSTVMTHFAMERRKSRPISCNENTNYLETEDNDSQLYEAQSNTKKTIPARFVTEVRLNIRSPCIKKQASVGLKQSIDKNYFVDIPHPITDRTSDSKDAKFKAVPGKAILHEDSFLPSPPPESVLAKRSLITPKINSSELTFSLPDALQTVSRGQTNKKKRGFIKNILTSPSLKRCLSKNEFNDDELITYLNAYAIEQNDANTFHGIPLSFKSSSQVTGQENSTSSSIRELLYGNSLLNLDNLLRAPDIVTSVEEVHESRTLIISSPEEIFNYGTNMKGSQNSPQHIDRQSVTRRSSEMRNSRGTQVITPKFSKLYQDAEVQTQVLGINASCGDTHSGAFAIKVTESTVSEIGTKILRTNWQAHELKSKELSLPTPDREFCKSPTVSYLVHEAHAQTIGQYFTSNPKPVISQIPFKKEDSFTNRRGSVLFTTVITDAGESEDQGRVVIVDDFNQSQPTYHPPTYKRFQIPPVTQPRGQIYTHDLDVSTNCTLNCANKTFQQDNEVGMTTSWLATNETKSFHDVDEKEQRGDGISCTEYIHDSKLIDTCSLAKCKLTTSKTCDECEQAYHQHYNDETSIHRSDSLSSSVSSCCCSCCSCQAQTRATNSTRLTSPNFTVDHKTSNEKNKKDNFLESHSNEFHRRENFPILEPVPTVKVQKPLNVMPAERNKSKHENLNEQSVTSQANKEGNMPNKSLNLLAIVGDKHKRELLQRWLLDQVSANVARRVGNQIIQKFQEPIRLKPVKEVLPSVSNCLSFRDASMIQEASDTTCSNTYYSSSEESESSVKLSVLAKRKLKAVADFVKKEKDKEKKLRNVKNKRSTKKDQENYYKPQNTEVKKIKKSKEREKNEAKKLEKEIPNKSLERKNILQSQQKDEAYNKNNDKNRNKDQDTKKYETPKTVKTKGNNEVSTKEFPNHNLPCERIIILNPFDDIVRSYQNNADRRVKSVAFKNSCFVSIIGPFKQNSSDSTFASLRFKETYRLIVASTTLDRVDKCINYFKETFPHSTLRNSIKRY